MRRWFALAACSCWLSAVTGAAVAADGAAPQRARIDAERRDAQAQHAADRAQCAGRFAVTACTDAADTRQRDALGALRMQELALDDLQRQQRAARRQHSIDSKRAGLLARPPAPPEQPAVPREPAVSESAATESASTPEAGRGRPQPAGDKAQAAARRASAAERRREDAAVDRARIAEREAQRNAGDKKSAPLPVPPAGTLPPSR